LEKDKPELHKVVRKKSDDCQIKISRCFDPRNDISVGSHT